MNLPLGEISRQATQSSRAVLLLDGAGLRQARTPQDGRKAARPRQYQSAPAAVLFSRAEPGRSFDGPRFREGERRPGIAYPWLIARTEENRNDQAEKARASVRRSGIRYRDYRRFGAEREAMGARPSSGEAARLPLMLSLSKDDGEAADRRRGERNGQLTPRA